MAVGWKLFAQRAVSVILFRFVRLVFTVVQRIFWELNGTASQLRDAVDSRHYERSAQVLDVILERHFCEMQTHCLEEFLCVHNRFENPQFVIDNEHVTLLTITPTSAVFGVARKKDMRLWKTEFNSFLKMAQPLFCNQLIIVPLPVFHRMAETIGDPKGELIFIFNTARCGSTLLTQIMEYTGRCISISEPDSPNVVAAKYRLEGDTPLVRQLARDVIRWDCRPYPSMQPQPLAYAVKLSSPAAVALNLFVDLYPKSRKLFMYRDVVKNSKSLYRMAYSLPSVFLAYKLGRLSGLFVELAANSMGLAGRDYRYRLENDLDLGIVLNNLVMKIYMDIRRSGNVEIAGVRYEDLVSNSAEAVRRIIEFCGLPSELVEPGLRGLEVDSQRNSVIAKSVIGALPEPELNPQTIRRANEMLRRNGLPQIGEDCLLEGTITHCERPTIR